MQTAPAQAESAQAQFTPYAYVTDPTHALSGQTHQIAASEADGHTSVWTGEQYVRLAPGTFTTAWYDQSQGTWYDPSASEMETDEHIPQSNVASRIVQADFMSGDRYGIAAALTMDKTLGIVVLTTSETRDRAEDMKKFYDKAIESQGPVGNRVMIREVPNTRDAYKDRENLSLDTGQKSATYGTAKVAEMLRDYGVEGDDGVPAFLAQQWLGEPRKDSEDEAAQAAAADADRRIKDWLDKKGITKDGKHAFLWVKTGAADAEKSHHFTDPGGVQQIINEMAGRKPVLIGDSIDVNPGEAGVVLGSFWNDPSFPFRDEGRIGQLRLFRYLAKSPEFDAVNLGMRSGALEGPALMGMPTIYMEEQGNAQALRMEKWLPGLTNYHRAILSAVPGNTQSSSLANTILQTAKRVKNETPTIRNGQMVVDRDVPAELQDKYVDYLEQQAKALLDGASEGFQPEDLDNIQELLSRSGEELSSHLDSRNPAFSNKNPSYGERFLRTLQQG